MIPHEPVGDLVLDTGVGGQRVLVGLLNLVVLGNLHVNFVLDDVDPIVDCWRINLVNFVLDSSLISS